MTKEAGQEHPLFVAIVGSGPSGFYAAEALIRSGRDVHVDLIERLPTPFGLVRSGVAPDHPKLKQSIQVFERILGEERLNFFGNVMLGRDVSARELQDRYHAVILACGAQTDRCMGIPGEDLAGSHTATEFVGWYNGHPDYRDCTFDLSGQVAVVVGHGNVAADVCRILAKPVDDLRDSDIAEHALDALSQSQIEEIHVVGRRGPAQAKFTPKELRELGEISGARAHVDPHACHIGPQCDIELSDPTNTFAAKNVELFRSYAKDAPSPSSRTVKFRFMLSPIALTGEERVKGIRLAHNDLTGPAFSQTAHPNGDVEEVSCSLVFRSIGYRSAPIDGVPFDNVRGVVPNDRGQVLQNGRPVGGLYVTGWQKRGATGIIGTNRADSLETVERLLSNVDAISAEARPGTGALRTLLAERRIPFVGLEGWRAIDAAEIARGKAKGKPREKITRVDEMLHLTASGVS